MSVTTKSQADREAEFQAAVRDLAAFVELQRQTVAAEMASMLERGR